MHTRSRVLFGLLAACVFASCGGSGTTPGTTDLAGRTQPTESDGPSAPPKCDSAACEPTPEPTTTPQCTADDQCATVLAPCSVCPDGSSTCPRAVCSNGQCNVIVSTCPKPTGCGGLASLPCAEGYTCVDDPNGGCEPDASGAGCLGVCVPIDKPRACSGITGAVCPPNYRCVDDPTDQCDPETGADCGGTCQPVEPERCETDADCPAIKAECSMCPDGSAACPYSSCVNGQCQVGMPACPSPSGCGGIAGITCKPGYTCVDDPTDRCDPTTGGADCPAICVPDAPPPPARCGGFTGEVCPADLECVDDPSDECDPTTGGADCPGVCQPGKPTGCRDDSDCPQLKVACSVCADGTVACPQSTCTNGQCDVVVPKCASPNTCGGIAGIPCQKGYQCVDDPNDTCDPTSGGADCPGICAPVGPPPPLRCAGFAGTACPDGFECIDDPADDCDPATGGADCGGLCQQVPSSQCKTDADCVVIGAPCKLCADGTFACPMSSCRNGQCTAVFEGCAPTP